MVRLVESKIRTLDEIIADVDVCAHARAVEGQFSATEGLFFAIQEVFGDCVEVGEQMQVDHAKQVAQRFIDEGAIKSFSDPSITFADPEIHAMWMREAEQAYWILSSTGSPELNPQFTVEDIAARAVVYKQDLSSEFIEMRTTTYSGLTKVDVPDYVRAAVFRYMQRLEQGYAQYVAIFSDFSLFQEFLGDRILSIAKKHYPDFHQISDNLEEFRLIVCSELRDTFGRLFEYYYFSLDDGNSDIPAVDDL